MKPKILMDWRRSPGTYVYGGTVAGVADVVAARFLVWVFLSAATLSQLGCSGNPTIGKGVIVPANSVPVTEDRRDQFGTVGVTTARVTRQDKLVDNAGMARGALDGAMSAGRKGLEAGLATAHVLLGAAVFTCVVPTPGCLGGLGAVGVGAAALVVGPVSGAIAGALVAESEETILKSETAVSEAVIAQAPGDMISDDIAEVLRREGNKAVRISVRPEAPSLADTPDTLLDTEIVELLLSPRAERAADINPPFQLSMTIQSRVRRKSDGVELAAHSASYQSKEHPLTLWADNDAGLFRGELKAASRRLAEEMVAFLVLRYPEAVELLTPADEARVHTLEPTLSWTPFPAQGEEPGGLAPHIHNTQYELRVLHDGEIYYQRTGLSETTHEIDEPLLPCRDFQWRARASFEVAENVRVSQWSPTKSFKTPCYWEPGAWGIKVSTEPAADTLPEER